MKDNDLIRIIGKNVELVPYDARFVAKYHQWMFDPYLLEMTASEPLSLDEEYAMQRAWRDDPMKCTFIVLTIGDGDPISRMIGDVNLFLQRIYEDDIDQIKAAEIDVMIAESAARGRGYGQEAVLLMLWYGYHSLCIQRFFAKINETNTASLKLFRRLGFDQVGYSEAFKEVEFSLSINQDWLSAAETTKSGNVPSIQPWNTFTDTINDNIRGEENI